ncbi:MAG: alpha/beta fold hydrolase [Thermoleophilia bacterium]|nr:alpha/beta fold hydrolase [Thermoleophilia bacterium]
MGERFVLVHGAWHGGWCWEGIIRELERAGHHAEAPTMPGMNPGDDRSAVTFDDVVDALVNVLRRQDRPVVLVGHSSAGFLLQAAAPRVPEKIKRVIFLNAFVLPDGACQFDLVPPEAAEGLAAAANASPDRSVPVIEEMVRGVLMAGDAREAQDDVLSRLSPQPVTLFTTRVDTKAFNALPVPKTVVFCRDDTSLPPGAFLGMAQSLGDFELIEIPGGHEALVVTPEVVAGGILQAIAAG